MILIEPWCIKKIVAFFNFIQKKEKIIKPKKEEDKVLSISEFVKELGIGREGVIGSYNTE